MKKITYPLAALILLALYSCDEFSEKDPQERSAALIDFNSVFTTQKDTDKRLFSEALVESMHQSRQLREIIKTEALTRFNNDTEVLYVLIMDKPVENGTVHDLMASNTKGGLSALNSILDAQPLLTILVPTLPEGSFSAERWDAASQVPAVGIRLSNNNDTAFIWDTGFEEVIPGDYIPGFPALAVKENERLVISTDPVYNTLDTNIVYNPSTATASGPNVSIRYAGKVFDGVANPDAQLSHTRVVDPKIVEAYNYSLSENMWQRDYIYYGIYSGQQTGTMDYSFTEAIGEFTMDADALSAYRKISDNTGGSYGYPEMPPSRSNRNYWTEGCFDFRMNTLLNRTEGEAELGAYISINPTDLFELEYTRHSDKKWLLRPATWYTVKSGTNKVYYANAPLTDWNIMNKSLEWKISVEEVDLAGTTALSTQNWSRVATNFTQAPGGEFIKTGPDYGGNFPAPTLRDITKFSSLSCNELGDVIVNFGDKVIVNAANPDTGTPWHYRHYSTGYAKFTVEPVKTD